MLNSYCLRNKTGVTVRFSNLGGRIHAVEIPCGEDMINIIPGVSSLEDFLKQDPYMGALCGRYANRISKASFKLEDKIYHLSQNDSGNHLHGGTEGFHLKHWNVREIENKDTPGYLLQYLSADGEEGYPGNLNVKVFYVLNDLNELHIDIQAVTDAPTIVNITSHPYFNLKGYGDILDHTLTLFADTYCPVTNDLIPTGELRKTAHSPFDLVNGKILSTVYSDTVSKGIDHNYVLNKIPNELSLAAVLSHENTGRKMELYTTQNCLQVYTGKHFESASVKRRNGMKLQPFDALALEAQDFPDAPNQDLFPDVLLRPGELYKQKIIYKFIF